MKEIRDEGRKKANKCGRKVGRWNMQMNDGWMERRKGIGSRRVKYINGWKDGRKDEKKEGHI